MTTERAADERTMTRGADTGASFAIAPDSWDPATRQIDVIGSLGSDVRRRDRRTGELYVERLSMDPKAWKLDRFNRVGVLLDAHNGYDNAAVIGRCVPGTARIEDGQFRFRAVLSDAPGDADIVRKIVTGIIPATSVGYDTLRVEKSTENEVEVRTAVEIDPFECSAVPIGADSGAMFRSRGLAQSDQPVHDSDNAAPTPHEPETRSAMSNPTNPTPAVDHDAQKRAIDDAVDAAVRARDTRRDAIFDSAKRLKLDVDAPEVRALCAADNRDDEATWRGKLIDLAAKRADKTQIASGFRTAEYGEADREKRTAGMEEALLRRFAPECVKAPTENGSRFLGQSVLRIAANCLEDTGVDTRFLPDSEIIARALGNATQTQIGMTRAPTMLGTSDFPTIMSNLMGKKLRRAYEELPQDWKQLSTQTTAENFKTQTSIQIGEGSNLTEVPEHGEIQQGTTSESSEEWNLKTYAKIYNLTRQMLINDQLGAFMRFLGTRGNAAARLENAMFWALFNANSGAGKTMKDGFALCSTQHANLVSGGGNVGAPTAATLGATRVMLDKMKGLDGAPIDVGAKFIVGPAELRTAIATLLGPTMVPTKQADVIPSWVYGLTPIITPRLASASKWYLVADPAGIEQFVHAYLAGQEGVYTEQRYGWEVDGIQVKTRLDFGVGVNDYRGIVLNPGA